MTAMLSSMTGAVQFKPLSCRAIRMNGAMAQSHSDIVSALPRTPRQVAKVTPTTLSADGHQPCLTTGRMRLRLGLGHRDCLKAGWMIDRL